LDRLHTIQWFFHTVIEFLKLEKVEIGGLKGRILSGRITAVSLEFNQCFSSFASKTYDVLDPDDESFKGDFLKFQERILELDMKLAVSKKICMMIIDQLHFYINSQDLNL
jgi:dynein heavy chain